MPLPTCDQTGCPETALSFGRHCWNHADRERYPSQLREGLRNLGPGQHRLWLKKVCADNIDFSDRSLAGSCLSQSHLNNCSFIGADLTEADLIGARITNCDFVGADMSRSNLTRATVTNSSFSHADLREAYFTEANLRDTDFMGSCLAGATLWNADFTQARHIKRRNFTLQERSDDKTEARHSENQAQIAQESYRSLKHYFTSKGLYEDASWAAYRERIMERKHYWNKKNIRYVPSLLMDLLSGYTEKPGNVIASSLAIILLFGAAYYLFRVPYNMAFPDRSVGLWDSIYFSFITFTTVGYGDLVPHPTAAMRLLTCVEAFTGPFMAGLYVFTLTRRYAAQ